MNKEVKQKMAIEGAIITPEMLETIKHWQSTDCSGQHDLEITMENIYLLSETIIMKWEDLEPYINIKDALTAIAMLSQDLKKFISL